MGVSSSVVCHARSVGTTARLEGLVARERPGPSNIGVPAQDNRRDPGGHLNGGLPCRQLLPVLACSIPIRRCAGMPPTRVRRVRVRPRAVYSAVRTRSKRAGSASLSVCRSREDDGGRPRECHAACWPTRRT